MAERKFPGPISTQLLKDADTYCATTTMASRICVSRRYGPIVEDYDGFKFIDFHCDASVNNLGGDHPVLKEAMLSQAGTGNFFSEHNNSPVDQTVRLSKLLTEKSPVPTPAKVYIGNSGAEANEAALKLCRCYRWRHGEENRWSTIFFENAFHGRTLGILPGTSSKPETQRDPFWTSWDKNHTHTPPYPTKGTNAYYFKKYFADIDPNLISIVFIELPCQGEGGVIPADMELVRYVYEWTRKHDIFFVVDSIQCGMGRTGHLFGCDPTVWGWLKPDILVLGKALGGGQPNGATIYKSDLDFKPGMHSSTFGGGPVVTTTSLAAFKEIEKLILNGTVGLLAERLRADLTDIQEKFPHFITETRGVGAMWAHEIVSPEIRDRVIEKCEELVETEECGLRLLGAGRKAIRFMPPLNIDHKTLELGFSLYEKVLSSV